MGRPRGHYITIEAPEMVEGDEGYHREISLELANIIRKMINRSDYSALIVGLGNRDVTPDALGPRVIDNMFITRHIIKEYGKYAFGDEKIRKISGIVPGVMAQTGMECLEIIRGVVRETEPDFVITVDALAARNARRLGRTIQLTDTGITPGSGIGNHRHALNEKSVGIPVISLGVPTVVDAATIVSDAMNSLIFAMPLSDLTKLDETERQELARELLSPQLHGMFVTPKDIDESIKRLSFLISEGLNIALTGNKEQEVHIK
jgi:spore protease